MKFTKYFDYTRERLDRKIIKMEWIVKAFYNPVHEELQNDGRIRRWAKIDEMDGKFLRIIVLPDMETVHNAFFDRNFGD